VYSLIPHAVLEQLDPLLGATTLEGFGLVLDPFRRELRPMSLPLKKAWHTSRIYPDGQSRPLRL